MHTPADTRESKEGSDENECQIIPKTTDVNVNMYAEKEKKKLMTVRDLYYTSGKKIPDRPPIYVTSTGMK